MSPTAIQVDTRQSEGIAVRTGSQCLGGVAREQGDRGQRRLQRAPTDRDGSHTCCWRSAGARTPMTSGLGAAGIATDARGYIVVDDSARDQRARHLGARRLQRPRRVHAHRRTTTTRSSPPTCLDGEHRKVSDRIPTYALFIDPPLGRVGADRARGARAWTAGADRPTMPMSRVGRARERGETQGFMKVLVDARVESASWAPRCWASNGDEVVHALLDTMAAKAPYTTLRRTMHMHPTVSELIPTLLGDLKPLQ